jgi:hypothetical protein
VPSAGQLYQFDVLMAGTDIYFEKYFQESSIAILQFPNLYLFEYQQMLVYN